MNIDQEKLLSTITSYAKILQQHLPLIIIVAFCGLYGYIIMQISTISGYTPDETEVTEQVTAVSKPKVDTQTAKIIESLEEQNINVQTIFNEARDNPFSE